MKRLRVRADPAPDLGQPCWQATWPSDLRRKDDAVEAAASAIAAAGPISDEEAPWLRLCLDEIVVNAMVHGNEADPDLPVSLGLWADGNGWTLRVGDRGRGFDPAAIPDPGDPSSLLLEHGRGIRIMLDWLDRLAYHDGGRTVDLARRYHHPAPRAASPP